MKCSISESLLDKMRRQHFLQSLRYYDGGFVNVKKLFTLECFIKTNMRPQSKHSYPFSQNCLKNQSYPSFLG